MHLRRSERLNPSLKSGENLEDRNIPVEQVQQAEQLEQAKQTEPTQNQLKDHNKTKSEPNELDRERQSDDPQKILLDSNRQEIKTEVECDSKPSIKESPDKNVSAITKALTQMENGGAEKKKIKKPVKMSVALRKKKTNQRLSKLLIPKNATILLNELKPGCTYKILEISGSNPPSFVAEAENDNVVLGKGQGLSKSQAKNSAAESAIKTIVLKALSDHSSRTEIDGKTNDMDISEDSFNNFPWAGLASFAIFKMFTEWQNQTEGIDLLSVTRLISKQRTKPVGGNTTAKKEIPPNATQLHPSAVLNMMYPGLTAIEIERKDGPNCQVKMGYQINGTVYTGVAGNKKDAKKEAAKAVLSTLYGLSYNS